MGYPTASYELSKVGVIAITKIQQRAFNSDPRPDLIVSAVCPGYCSSDMTEDKGVYTTEQGLLNFVAEF